MPAARSGHSACVLGGLIYVAGGLDFTVVRYDPSSDTWSTLASMPQRRIGCALFALDGCVYAAGGHGNATVVKYEPEFDRWSAVASMTTTRAYLGACALTLQVDVFDAMVTRALH
jgi:hypothetical protein